MGYCWHEAAALNRHSQMRGIGVPPTATTNLRPSDLLQNFLEESALLFFASVSSEIVGGLLNQRRNLSGNRNLQHSRFLFFPGFDGGLFDRINVLNARCIAPIASREGDDVDTGNVKTGEARRLLKDRKRCEDAVCLVAHDNDQHGKMQLRGIPDRLK